MMKPPEYSRLLRLAGAVLKYYLLSWFCLGVICIVFAGFGAFQLVSFLLTVVGTLLLRLAIFVFCFVAVAVIAESLRHW
jgi:hypothetical protein